jgi:hypothetical protein
MGRGAIEYLLGALDLDEVIAAADADPDEWARRYAELAGLSQLYIDF